MMASDPPGTAPARSIGDETPGQSHPDEHERKRSEHIAHQAWDNEGGSVCLAPPQQPKCPAISFTAWRTPRAADWARCPDAGDRDA